MNHLLTAAFRFILLFGLFICFLSSEKIVAQSCNNWLSLPAQGSKITVGDVDVTGTQLTVEAMFNRSAPLNNGIYYGHLVSKHTDQTNVNYALLPNGCEITTSNRWGERIFFTRNAGQCWDGTYKGTKQNGGVYVYMVRAKTTCENEVFRKGTFVLVR